MFRSFDDILTDPRGWPTIRDFENERVYFDYDLIRKAERKLKLYSPCILCGAEGRGKTVLARTIAYRFLQDEKSRIFFVDFVEVKDDQFDELLGQIKTLAQSADLLVVENVHRSDQLASSVVELVEEQQVPCAFLFTTRESLKAQPREDGRTEVGPFEEWSEGDCFVELAPISVVAERIVAQFSKAEQVAWEPSQEDRFWIKEQFGESSVNLRRLKWFLEAWKRSEYIPLAKLGENTVKREVLSYYRHEMMRTHQDAEVMLSVLTSVATVFQFDVEYLGSPGELDSLRELERIAVIQDSGGGSYRMAHATDARYLVAAQAQNPDDLTGEELLRYARKGPENAPRLLSALIAEEQDHFLGLLLSDDKSMQSLLDLANRGKTIEIPSRLITYLAGQRGEEIAKAFWDRYKDLAVANPWNPLIDRIKRGGLAQLRGLILSLKRISEREALEFLTNCVTINGIVDILNEETSSFTDIVHLLSAMPPEVRDPVIAKLDAASVKSKAENLMILPFARLFKSTRKGPLEPWLLACSNPELLAERAVGCSRASIMIMLKMLHDREFGCRLLARLLQKQTFVQGFLHDVRHFYDLAHCARKFGCESIFTAAAGGDTINVWRRSGLLDVQRAIGYCVESNSKVPEIEMIMKELANGQLKEKIDDLYAQRELEGTNEIANNPIMVMGKYLYFVRNFYDKRDASLVRATAKIIVESIRLKGRDDFRPEHLAVLLDTLHKVDEILWQQLRDKIFAEINLADFIAIPIDRGLGSLLRVLFQAKKENALTIVQDIVRLNLRDLLAKSDIEAATRLLLTLSEIDQPVTEEWIKSTSVADWISPLRALDSDRAKDALWAMWVVVLLDSSVGRDLIRLYAEERLLKVPRLGRDDIALAGLCLYYGLCSELKAKESLSPQDFVRQKDILGKIEAGSMVFILHFYRQRGDEQAQFVRREISALLYDEGRFSDFLHAIEDHPHRLTRPTIESMHADFPMVEDPRVTFTWMVRTFISHAHQPEIVKTDLRKMFLTSATSRGFDSPGAFELWLGRALKEKIFIMREEPHRKNPDQKVKLISLNRRHELVSTIARR